MNLLTDPLFRIETLNGLEHQDLPGLLEALGKDRVASLPGLQRHQEDAWHVFLCYLAGAVLNRAQSDDPRQDAPFWRAGIRGLTRQDGGEDDSAWILVVEDPSKPAFMQTPCSSAGDARVYQPKAASPDALDLLPTAKNHDLKACRAVTAQPEDWVYALVSLQTMSGFFGSGNYGIARMNSGSGSRPVVALEYHQGISGRWRDQVTRILAMRGELLGGVWGYRAKGLVLTWVPPWDHHTSLSLAQLDPFFIEVARPVRLTNSGHGIQALGVSSKAPRIAAKAANGRLGDPWIPINLGKQAALTLSGAGITPELLRNLLWEDGFQLTPLQKPAPASQWQGDGGLFSVAVLVRGQGTTDGFHQVQLPIPGKTLPRLFGQGPERDALAFQSKIALNDSGVMEQKVLKPAVLALLEGGPKQVNFDRREVSRWWTGVQREFAAAWASEFFPWLWRVPDQPDRDTARLEWLGILRRHAEAALASATARYPQRQGRRYQARVRAEGIFIGSLYKLFPCLKENAHDHGGNG